MPTPLRAIGRSGAGRSTGWSTLAWTGPTTEAAHSFARPEPFVQFVQFVQFVTVCQAG